MSMKPPTPEQLEQQLQEAEAEHDRVREANRELQENFCPVSLGDWLNLCGGRRSPTYLPPRSPRYCGMTTSPSTLKANTAPGLGQLWKTIQSARKDNQMMRLDCCTDEEVKYRMSRGDGGGFQPTFGGIIFGDMRSFDMVNEYPRDNIPIWQRPWAETQVIDGYPVEYRAFRPERQAAGHQQLLPPATAALVSGAPEGSAELH